MLNLTPLEQVHFDTLTKWRKAMDLVGPGPLEPHFEDARRAVGWLAAEGSWADLGSGAGFPGVALAACYPEVSVTLVESRQKRVMFLREVVSRGGVDNVNIFHGRSETLEKRSYDGVISRAFRPPEEFLAEARDLLVMGGTAVLMLALGEPPTVEGLELFHVEQYPLDDRTRKACGYRKIA